mgnify:CR=1 FL=1
MKKKGKRIVSLAVTLAMIAGLTACGKDGSGNGGSSAADSGLAKQYVFKEQALDLGVDSDNMGIDLLTLQGDTVYLMYEIYDYSGDYVETDVKLATLTTDGTLVKTVDLPLWKEGEAPAAPAPSNGVEEGDTPANEDGGAVARTVEDLSAATMDVIDAPVSNDYSYMSTNLQREAIAADGTVYGIRNFYKENYVDDEYVSESTYALLHWDADGNITGETDLTDMLTEKEDSSIWIYDMILNEDGSVTFLLSGDAWKKCTVTPEGELTDMKDIPQNVADILGNGSRVGLTSDGKYQITYWDLETYSEMYIASYDPVTDQISEGIKLADAISNGGYYGLVSIDENTLYYSNDYGLYRYDIPKAESTQIMSYINSDLSTTSMDKFVVLSDTEFIGFYNDIQDGSNKGGLFTYVKPEDIKDKAVLVLAGNYIDWNLRKRVVEYNKASDDYRIVVKDYSTYNTSEDYELGTKQLNNDIISGNMPDILIVNYDMVMDSYISKGLIANVDDLIAKDEELSQNEYLQNVWDAYRADGKLYYVIPSFYVSTMLGKQSIFGDRTSITMEELEAIQAGMPENPSIFGDTVLQSDFLNLMMSFCGNDFVDVSTGKCNFDTDNFVAMLTYASGLPQEHPEDFWEDYSNNYESQFRENRTLLESITISSISDLNREINGVMGEDVSFVGFPTDGDNGSVIISGNVTYALSAKSKNLGGAWDFVRYYLTKDYQDQVKDQEYNLPVMRSSFEVNVNEATERPYYLDENGNKVEYDETYYINGEEIVLPQMTKEQADKIVSFIESINKSGYYNDEINNIINEEAGAYFSGQKSAKDVASVIQNRVQVYVNENR